MVKIESIRFTFLQLNSSRIYSPFIPMELEYHEKKPLIASDIIIIAKNCKAVSVRCNGRSSGRDYQLSMNKTSAQKTFRVHCHLLFIRRDLLYELFAK